MGDYLLANLYLDVFDEEIKALGVRLIRFADDFIVLTRGERAAEALLDVAEDCLQHLGLKLNLDVSTLYRTKH